MQLAEGESGCQSLPVQRIQGTDTGDYLNTFYGNHAQIHTTEFAASQCDSIRSIGVLKLNGDFVEMGWFASGDTKHHVFKAYQEGTHYHDDGGSSGYQPGANSDHPYKIVNADGSSGWAFDYEGNYIGSYAPGFNHGDYLVTNSEGHQGSDDLNAHFSELKKCKQTGSSCSFNNWSNAGHFIDGDIGSLWKYCGESDTAHYVRKVGTSCP